MPGLHDLTTSQRAAVETIDGPLLVLAGPGSGKTRVITARIAHMIESGIDPAAILAITFTNKAADEMAARVSALSPGREVWVSTFHKFCARMLRRWAPGVGLKSNFTILDTSDQRRMVRHVLNDLDIDAVHFPPAKIAAQISRAKNDLRSAEDVARKFEESIGDHLQAVVARVYPAYQKALLESNAVDFDDLLLHMVALLSENSELRVRLGERFRYVLVDEYQDTNVAQYQIVAALSHGHRNLCVTGDPDQSIYGWRGARIDNILRFEADFSNAKVVRLEQNFRSTKEILRSADALIAHNVHRKVKSLVTDNPQGEPVELLCYSDGKQEADGIAREIRRMVEAGERQWSDFAVFYRVNALSREIELALGRHRVPFLVAAGVSFFNRAEVKDTLGYLRLIYNPFDETAFRRVVNTPRRGIGATTQSRLIAWAKSQHVDPLAAAWRAAEIPKMSKRAVVLLKSFAKMIDGFSLVGSGSIETLLRDVIERTGYVREWQNSYAEEDQQRLANVEELVTAARQYDRTFADDPTLEGFLEATSLAGEVDNVDQSAGQVTLMTLHAAKGLEYPVVFLLAVEQGLIPHERSTKTENLRELEEERRLLFVGMTRAEERLFLTQTVSREFRGRPLQTIPSDFLREMPILVSDRSFETFAADSQLLDLSGIGDAERTGEQSLSERLQDHPLLMTGADLLNGTHKRAEIPQGFGVGMQVRHPQYGLGNVVEVSGFSRNRKVTVEFSEDDRRQTFVVAKCPLQPVGLG